MMIASNKKLIQDEDGWSPPDVTPDSYTFSVSTSGLPENPLLMPTIGNGHIATVIYRDRLFMNGLYNGEGKRSHRAAIPAYNRMRVSSLSGQLSDVYSLNCVTGTFTHTQCSEKVTVVHTVYAHKTIPGLLVNHIHLERDRSSKEEISIQLDCGTDFISPDLTMHTTSTDTETDNSSGPVRSYVGTINEKEVKDFQNQITSVYILMDQLLEVVTLASEEQTTEFTFLMSVGDTEELSKSCYNIGKQMLTEGCLSSTHTNGWINQWQTARIDIWSEDLLIRQIVYGSQYYLMSSLPSLLYHKSCSPGEFFGLSPESLAYGDMSEDDYLGHVFWDQETWMYPPILLLYPELAAHMLSARLRVLSQALQNAKDNQLKGAKFPWEQGVTGVPVSPSDDCEKYELHINADIALGIRQYAYATGTVSQDYLQLAVELAEFWKSRLSWIETKNMFGINEVMPPDEFNYPVDNSAYTNVAADLAMKLPADLKDFDSSTSSGSSEKRMDTGRRYNEDVEVYVPFDEQLQYHPEFDGYSISDPHSNVVKQADVVLIGYPLCMETSKSVRKNDLELYEKVTTRNGPAMTWSMFCVGHLELDQTDEASEMFDRQLLQATPPFRAWSEYPDGKGAINFITGMGGFLQSLLFGYLGIRLQASSMTVRPHLHSGWNRLKVTGVSYRGGRFNIDVNKQTEMAGSTPKVLTSIVQTSTANKHYDITQDSDTEIPTFTVKERKGCSVL